ncbi:hypothetical protein B7494_g2259 [Chlorociboria aeruginascens]|nr:hypothetical protein B7494_g2259 [Chlorociboria aeruginascens]
MSSYGTSPPLNNYSTTYDLTPYVESLPPSTSMQDNTSRATPNSLGWSPNTELWKLYKFVVAKGKEPYLDLLPEWTITNETPERVYLDPSPCVHRSTQ